MEDGYQIICKPQTKAGVETCLVVQLLSDIERTAIYYLCVSALE
jgi:hypothetical protein